MTSTVGHGRFVQVQPIDYEIERDEDGNVSLIPVYDFQLEPDVLKCPTCGGYADNGFDRCVPPNPYLCTKCEGNEECPQE